MRRLFTPFLDWLLSTSVYTALCALVLCLATERLLLGYIPALPSALHLLVVGSTLLEYNVHHLFNRSLSVGAQSWSRYAIQWHYAVAGAGAIACLAVLPYLTWQVMLCCGVLGLMSFAYSTPLLPFRFKKRLKDYGLIKITVLTGVWVIVTTVLPVVYWNGSFSGLWLELILRSLLIFALCLAFDIRDVAADTEHDIDTLPSTIGVRASYRLIDVTLLLFLLEGVLQYLRRGEAEHLIDILLTALAAKGAIFWSGRRPHPYVYLGVVDGVMLLYGLLVMF